MARQIEDAGDEGKRVTVLFNLKDWGWIEKELARQEKKTGYAPAIADVLRQLVRDGLPK